MSIPTAPPLPPPSVKKPKLPNFYGYGVLSTMKEEIRPRDLVERIEAYCTAANRSTQCQELYLCLRGEAVVWYNSLSTVSVNKSNWTQLRKRFLFDFEYKLAGNVSYKLNTLSQRNNENVVNFFSRVDAMVSDFVADCPNITLNEVKEARYYWQKGLFMSGLREEIKQRALEQTFATLVEAKDFAQKIEYIQIVNNKKEHGSVQAVDELERTLNAIQTEEDQVEDPDANIQEEEIALLNRIRSRNGRRPIRGGGGYRGRGGFPTGNRFPGNCHNCGIAGHKAAQCRQPRRDIRSLDDDSSQDIQPLPTTLSSIKNW